MSADTLNILIKAIVTAISIILTTFVVPWLKSKIDDDKLVKLENYCSLAIRCAEQIYTTEEYQQKKAYVLDYISNKAEEIGIDATAEDLENIIEGLVNEIKKG